MYYNKDINDVLKELNTSKEGLTSQSIKEKTTLFGLNTLQEKKKKNIFQVFLMQFCDLLVIILIIASILSALTGNVESMIVILCVIFINALLGTIQYIKAEKSLDSLKKISSLKTKVIRDNKKVEVDSTLLLPGDIIFLEAGDIAPADCRIIDCYSLQVNESSLTGESLLIDKNNLLIDEENEISITEQYNMLFSSSLIVNGRAHAVVCYTGMNSEIGKIANLLNETKERKTPLQKSLDNFSKILSLGIVILCVILLVINIYRDMSILDSLMFAISLAVAAIPEALSSIVTIALAIGTNKMSKENAIVKDLKCIESLGCVSVICSDKTGTLTQNKMSVVETYYLGENSYEELLNTSVLCNDACIENNVSLGDPTEIGLLEYYLKVKDNILIKNNKRLNEIPFDSERKMMSVFYNIKGCNTMYCKGAFDIILNKVTSILDNGIKRNITTKDIDNFNNIFRQMGEKGYRVLAFTKKDIDNEISSEENNLTLIGLIAMIDPPREEVYKSINQCKEAGVMCVMITGDHKLTASKIASDIGIINDTNDIVLDGSELSKMSDDELIKIIRNVKVYARVNPSDKIRIVKLFQQLNYVVAMTGDGVNDAPALKAADVGIAMGISGTQVSKDASSIILMDDNFSTIVKAVSNGRSIYENITNSIKFLLSGNFAAIICVVYSTILGLCMPFAPVHLLFINLLTDSLPAIAIGVEKPNKDLLKIKPRNVKESIITKRFLLDILLYGFLICIVTLISFYVGLQTNEISASTMAFSTLCLARLWHSLNCRSKTSFIKQGLFSNKYIWLSIILGISLLSLVLFIPSLHDVFEVTSLSLNNYILVFSISIIPTLIIQLTRIFIEIIKSQRN